MRHTAVRLARPLSAALALAATAACASYVRPAVAPIGRDADADARRLLAAQNGGAAADPARVAAVATALATVRSRVPEVRDMAIDPVGESFVVVLDSAASARWLTGHDADARGLSTTGVAALDAVTASLGGAQLDAGALAGGVSFSVRFRRPVDLTAAAEAYAPAAGVRYAGAPPADHAAPVSWTMMVPRGTQTNFVFARACAEAPTCEGAEYFYVTYDALTKSAFLVAHENHGASSDNDVATWDMPGRGAAGVYATFDDVLAGLGDRRWWQRRHAVDVLDALLDTMPNAFVPNDHRGAAHLAALRHEAVERRNEALDALAPRVADSDMDVAALSVAALQGLTRQPIGGGEDGATAWHAWLAMNAPMAPALPRAPQSTGRVARAARR